MQELSYNYKDNIDKVDRILNVDENFDIIKREMVINNHSLTLYYIDGFVNSAVMQKLMIYLVGIKDFGEKHYDSAEDFAKHFVPAVEVDPSHDLDKIITMILSGCSAIFADGFGDGAVIVDTRTYPARETEEPENDKVMRGARDGFVETLIFNTAMIRRRIRDPNLIVKYACVGECSRTDISIVYIKGKADPVYVKKLTEKINSIKTDALPLGHQSLLECLIKKRWYNPFPKVRCTERPDAACASIAEGSVIVITDTSPEIMILPTSIFDFFQETDDFYFPPLTGSYLRIIRQLVFWCAISLTPVWFLLIQNPDILPKWLEFIIPKDPGEISILAQLLLIEFILDGLKLASLNTPSVMSNSFSVVGGLLLGDFAVQVGWLSPDVIFYMAVISIAGFTQSNYELGYAFKFIRIISIILISFLNYWGLIIGVALAILLICTNNTINFGRSYLYPLIPFNWKALRSLLIRQKKK